MRNKPQEKEIEINIPLQTSITNTNENSSRIEVAAPVVPSTPAETSTRRSRTASMSHAERLTALKEQSRAQREARKARVE